jgi:hypothetical protein
MGSSYHKGAEDIYLYDFKNQTDKHYDEFSTHQTGIITAMSSTKAVQQISG